MEYIREHPIVILKRISRFTILLLIPALRAIFFSGGSIDNWVTGVWIDFLALLFILLLATISWEFHLYCLDKGGIYQFTGICFIKKTFIPIEKITQISFESPWYLKIFGARCVRIETPAGSKFSPDLKIVLNKKAKLKFFNEIVNKDENHENIKVKFLSLVGLALFSANGITGVIFLATLISQSGKIIGSSLEKAVVTNVTQTVNSLAFGIPPVATTISIFIAIGFAFSFALNLLRYGKFSISRFSNKLNIENGNLVGRWFYLISVDKINFIAIKQTLITKLLGLYTVNINVIGYGKEKNEKSVLIPICRKTKALISLRRLLPEFKFSALQYKPKRKNFRRFLLLPLVAIFMLVVLLLIGIWFFPNLSSLIVFCFVMLFILDIALLVIKIFEYFHTGVCYKNGIFTVNYTRRLSFYRVCFSKQKLVKATIRQNVFQKHAGCCTVILHTLDEKRSCHVIPNIELDDAKKFL